MVASAVIDHHFRTSVLPLDVSCSANLPIADRLAERMPAIILVNPREEAKTGYKQQSANDAANTYRKTCIGNR
uniref:Uncharacterized protein n=1 Tax=Oryza punctata TaxID=4537 RepID=A0A0E0KGY4_ORYPU